MILMVVKQNEIRASLYSKKNKNCNVLASEDFFQNWNNKLNNQPHNK